MTRTGLTAALLLALVLAAPLAEPLGAAEKPSADRFEGGGSPALGVAARLAQEERRLLELVNDYRQARGLGVLAWNDALAAAAEAHNDDMVRRDYFAHCGPDGGCLPERLAEAGYRYRSAAENLAAGQRTPLAVLRAWQDSPGHDENLLAAPMTEAGIDLDPRTVQGAQRLWTLVLGRPAD